MRILVVTASEAAERLRRAFGETHEVHLCKDAMTALALHGAAPADLIVYDDGVDAACFGARIAELGGAPLTLRLGPEPAESEALSRADQARRLAEQRFDVIFHQSPDPAALTTVDGRFLDVNERFLAMTGFQRAEVIGKTGLDLGIWPADPGLMAIYAELQGGRPVRDVEVRARRKSGAPFDVVISFVPVDVGGVPCVMSLGHDVTERKRLEEQLRHSQKMEALGRLAGGVAHDFNNVLTTIEGWASVLMERVGAGSPLLGPVEHIQRAAVRAAALTERLLALSRKQPVRPVVLDLNDVVANAEKMLARLIGEDVEASFKLHSGPCRVRADAGELDHVLLNLVINARDAMPTGGQITVETGCEDGRARLAVSDTGVGMSAETRARLFEPFFTTKEVGKGTGLGLSTVYSIVERTGGVVRVDSAPGEGTRFEITWPEAAPEEPAAPSPPQARALPARATILVAEDDEAVRDFVVFVLRQAGHEVLAADSGDAAVALVASHAGPVDLVLTDVVMPRMNGRELVQRLSELRPEIRVLHMSGYPGDTIARYGDLAPGSRFLQKPFSAVALAEAVQEALGDERR